MSESTYSNTNTARRAAVSKAWSNERALVLEGKGTRDWSKSEQAEIIATGKCKGYEGHHKCSVKNNPSQAGNEKNIQFVTKSEHIKAHNNNFKNDPQGRYDPKTQKITKYENGKIEPEPIIPLSDKMADSRKQSFIKKFESKQKSKVDSVKENAAKRAQSYEKRKVEKQSIQKSRISRNKADATKSSKALRASRSKANATTSKNISAKSSKVLSVSKSTTTSNSGKTSMALGVKMGSNGISQGAKSGGNGLGSHSGNGLSSGSGHGGNSGGGHSGSVGSGHGGNSGSGHGGHGK